jgi:hypothetical protein
MKKIMSVSAMLFLMVGGISFADTVEPKYDKTKKSFTFGKFVLNNVTDYKENNHKTYGGAGRKFAVATANKVCQRIDGIYQYIKNEPKSKTKFAIANPIVDEKRHPKFIKKIDSVYFLKSSKNMPSYKFPAQFHYAIYTYDDNKSFSLLGMDEDCFMSIYESYRAK